MKQYYVIVVTLGTILLWCVLTQIQDVFGSSGQIAVIPLVLFFGTGLLSTQDINNFPWSIVILAMGGIALGGAVSSSGLLTTIAGALQRRVMDFPLYAVLIIFGIVMLVVGTFVSHTVSAIIIIPLMKEVGEKLASRCEICSHPGVWMHFAVILWYGAGFFRLSKRHGHLHD